jgi:hypothetical protein
MMRPILKRFPSRLVISPAGRSALVMAQYKSGAIDDTPVFLAENCD